MPFLTFDPDPDSKKIMLFFFDDPELKTGVDPGFNVNRLAESALGMSLYSSELASTSLRLMVSLVFKPSTLDFRSLIVGEEVFLLWLLFLRKLS